MESELNPRPSTLAGPIPWVGLVHSTNEVRALCGAHKSHSFGWRHTTSATGTEDVGGWLRTDLLPSSKESLWTTTGRTSVVCFP